MAGSKGSGNVSGNTLNFNDGTTVRIISLYGGYTQDGIARNNKINIITRGRVDKSVMTGFGTLGAINNTLKISDLVFIYEKGYAAAGRSAGGEANNTLIIDSGDYRFDATLLGRSTSSGEASKNNLTIKDGAFLDGTQICAGFSEKIEANKKQCKYRRWII